MKIINTWLVLDGSYWTLLYEVQQQGTKDTRMCYIPKHRISGSDLGIRFISFETAHNMIDETNKTAS